MSFIVEFSKIASVEDVYAVYELAEISKEASTSALASAPSLGSKALDMLRRHKDIAAAGAIGSAGAYGISRLINKNKKTE